MTRFFGLCTLAGLLVLATTATMNAQQKKKGGGRGFGRGGGLMLLTQKSVQEELKLTEDQVKEPPSMLKSIARP